MWSRQAGQPAVGSWVNQTTAAGIRLAYWNTGKGDRIVEDSIYSAGSGQG